MIISSPGNQAVKRIRSLRRRKEREETGLFLVEGIRLVAEAAQQPANVETVVVAPDLLTSEFGRGIVKDLTRAGVPIVETTPRVFESFSSKEGPQGLVAVVRQRWEALSEVTPGDELCWIALAEVADPGNLGTILRTSDAVGAAGVMLLGTTTDPYDPESVRASMGAILSQHLVRAGIEDVAAWCRQYGCFLVGTSDAAAADYQDIAYRRPLVLLMGSERQGLSAEQKAHCDAVARLPMVGHSDSLNLAVATAVMLYEVFNQHRKN